MGTLLCDLMAHFFYPIAKRIGYSSPLRLLALASHACQLRSKAPSSLQALEFSCRSCRSRSLSNAMQLPALSSHVSCDLCSHSSPSTDHVCAALSTGPSTTLPRTQSPSTTASCRSTAPLCPESVALSMALCQATTALRVPAHRYGPPFNSLTSLEIHIFPPRIGPVILLSRAKVTVACMTLG